MSQKRSEDEERLLYLLLRLYIATQFREGWEAGPSEGEVSQIVANTLFNEGVDPGLKEHKRGMDSLLRKYDAHHRFIEAGPDDPMLP